MKGLVVRQFRNLQDGHSCSLHVCEGVSGPQGEFIPYPGQIPPTAEELAEQERDQIYRDSQLLLEAEMKKHERRARELLAEAEMATNRPEVERRSNWRGRREIRRGNYGND
jgi:hypothetical protein